MNDRLRGWKPQPSTVISILALFVAITGTAYAAGLAKDSVRSKQVKNDSLKAKDLKDGKAVGSAEVVDNSLKGADIDEASLTVSGTPTGAAGGDLAGTYPNPVVAARAVGAENFAGYAASDVDIGTVGDQRCTYRHVDFTNLGGDTILDDVIVASPDAAFEGEFAISAEPQDADTAKVTVCNNGQGAADPDGSGAVLRVVAMDFPG